MESHLPLISLIIIPDVSIIAYFSPLLGSTSEHENKGPVLQALTVDCANGVGAGKLERLKQYLPALDLDLKNIGSGLLNGKCGADYVQKGDAGAPSLPSDFSTLTSTSR